MLAQRELSLSAEALLASTAEAVRPAEVLPVHEWALRNRVVPAESGSPFPGKWRHRAKYTIEMMEVCGLDHPCQKVAIIGSAQSVKSEVGLNAIGATICQDPSPILVVLPSLDEAKKYNNTKLQAMFDASPELRKRLHDRVSRDEQGSTTFFKKFRGGYLVVTTASSSKGLQMISARVRVYEEVAEYPADVDGRGSPVDQGEARAIAWDTRGGKAIFISAPGRLTADAERPGKKSGCAITERYEASDMRRYYVSCPQCGHYQHLTWENMRWSADDAPYRPYFQCSANGCVIEEAEKSRLDASGRWIRTFRGDSSVNPAPPDAFPAAEIERWCARPTEGRYPGFHIWQAYNPLVSWERIVASYLSALASGSQALKPFHQQWLGKAWEEQGEAPAVERLLERRESWPTGRIPPGVLFLTGAVDVQGNRLEYAVYGWDRRLGGCLVDKGVLVGNPSQDAVWLQLDGILGTQYTDAWGKDWQVNRWAVDAGYLSSRVYMYARRHAASGRVMAVDGRPGWKLPAIGTPKGVKFQVEGRSLTAVIHPIGTWELKSEIYSKLALTVQGPGEGGVWPPGAMRFNETVDLQYLQQLTAEYLVRRRSRTGHITPEWVRKAGQANEAFDLAVYNLALAHRESDGLSTKRWDELAAARLGEADDLDGELAPLWSEEIRQVAEAPRLQPLPQHRRPAPLGRRIIHMAYHNRMRGEDA